MKEKVHQNAIVVAIRYHISDSGVALNGDAFCIMRLVWLVHMNSPHLTSQPFRWLRIRCRRIRCNHDHLLRVKNCCFRQFHFTPKKEKIKTNNNNKKSSNIRRDNNYTSLNFCEHSVESKGHSQKQIGSLAVRENSTDTFCWQTAKSYFFLSKGKICIENLS